MEVAAIPPKFFRGEPPFEAHRDKILYRDICLYLVMAFSTQQHDIEISITKTSFCQNFSSMTNTSIC
jgi:hypothetical protein